MRAVSLSGWGQPADALRAVWPDAVPVDYARHTKTAATYIREQAVNADLVIGWSLGAFLAMQLTLANYISPSKLVLIAPPLQFVKSDSFHFGMGTAAFTFFRSNYVKNPRSTLRKAHRLAAHGDSNAGQLPMPPIDELLKYDWLYWLDYLQIESLATISLISLAGSLIVHGENDAVIRHEQSRAIPCQARELWLECGHAPHLHDPVRLRDMISDYVR